MSVEIVVKRFEKERYPIGLRKGKEYEIMCPLSSQRCDAWCCLFKQGNRTRILANKEKVMLCKCYLGE